MTDYVVVYLFIGSIVSSLLCLRSKNLLKYDAVDIVFIWTIYALVWPILVISLVKLFIDVFIRRKK